ncbi:MAG: response regulator [Minicystis sp.]
MTSPVTILLLDEEPMLRRATALLLSNRGGSVTAAATPEEAVALAAARLYDVAIFDVASGGPSASEVLARIRAEGLVPRRVIAVCDGPLDPRAAEEIGEVLLKPYPFDRLLRAVFGSGGRSRTRSGIFPRTRPRGRAQATSRVTQRAPRRAARASRDRG